MVCKLYVVHAFGVIFARLQKIITLSVSVFGWNARELWRICGDADSKSGVSTRFHNLSAAAFMWFGLSGAMWRWRYSDFIFIFIFWNFNFITILTHMARNPHILITPTVIPCVYRSSAFSIPTNSFAIIVHQFCHGNMDEFC